MSSEDQREAGTIKTQRHYADEYCRTNNMVICDWYEDDGVSGAVPVDRRPAGARLLQDAAAGKFDTVLIYRVDRLARSTVELLKCVDLLAQFSVSIRSMSEPFETVSTTGRFILTMLGSVAQLEKDTIKERSWYGKLRVAREGRWTGGVAPLGYDVTDGRLQIKESEAALIREVFQLYVHDRLGTKRIADLLTARGVPLAAQTRGKKQFMSGIWNHAMVARILNNQTYFGKHVYRKTKTVSKNGTAVREKNTSQEDYIFTTVPAIVDEATWMEAQRLRGHNALMSPRNGKREYLLRGLMRCAGCGRMFVGAGPSGNPRCDKVYYKCSAAANSRSCGAPFVRQDLLEETVWTEIVEFVHNPGAVLLQLADNIAAEADEGKPIETELARLQCVLDDKQRERQRVISLIRKGVISEVEGTRELAQIQAEVQAVEGHREALSNRHRQAQSIQTRLANVETLLLQLRGAVENADSPTKRMVVEALVDRITINWTIDGAGKKKPHVEITYCFDQPQHESSEGNNWSMYVGEGNRFGHPSAETLDALRSVGVEVYRTDEDGTVEIIADRERMWVSADGR